MTILLKSSGELYQLIQEKTLALLRKQQKTQDAFNYYLNPSISFQINNPKVIICNSNYIVFQLDKYKNLSLYQMLKSINDQLYNYLKYLYNTEAETSHTIFSEVDDNFTLRCYLPHIGKKYSIQSTFFNKEVPFTLPKINCVIDAAIIDIKNLWEMNNRIGFNLELKVLKN